MSGIIPIIIWVFLILMFLISVANKKKKGAKKGQTAKPGMANQVRMMQDKQERMEEHAAQRVTREVNTYARRASRAYEHYEKTGGAGKVRLELEDDKNDWLACQLREEQKAYREVSEMFEAKLSHLSNCAAENLRLDHTLRCAAKALVEESRK